MRPVDVERVGKVDDTGISGVPGILAAQVLNKLKLAELWGLCCLIHVGISTKVAGWNCLYSTSHDFESHINACFIVAHKSDSEYSPQPSFPIIEYRFPA